MSISRSARRIAFAACLLIMVFAMFALAGCSGSANTTTTVAVPATSASTTSAPATSASTTGAPATSASTTGAPATSAQEIVVGAVLPLSGPLSMVGLQFSHAYEIYFDKVNEEGGITVGGQRYTFKYIAEDDKYSAEGATLAANKLVHQDGVKIMLMAGIAEFEAEAVYSVTKPAGVLLNMYSNQPGGPSDVGPDRPLLIRLIPSMDETTTIDVDFLKDTYPAVKKVAVSAHALVMQSQIDDLRFVLEQRGLEFVGVEYWDPSTTDFAPLMTKLLGYKPDAILAYGSAQGADQYRAARQLGFTGPIWDNSPVGAEDYLYVEPTITDWFCNGLDPGNLLPAMQEVKQRWEAKFKDPFMSDSIQQWDTGWILIQAIQKADSIEPENIVAAIESMTNEGDVQSVFGPARIGGMERFGVNRVVIRPAPLTRIMDGKVQLIGYSMGSNR